MKAQVGALTLEEAYVQAKLRVACFVLITNIEDTNEFPAERVLREYGSTRSRHLLSFSSRR
ncbi:MAG: hypothetical protein H5T95_14035 [Firmicutes bacterium]|nr:hypothetical protein [Bacillota bacterium]